MYAFICIAVFVLAYALTIAITSIGYHDHTKWTDGRRPGVHLYRP